jgi:4-hydroxybenzoate polyprenyltransferase
MRLLKLFDFIFLMRPIILIPFWSFLLLGYAHSHRTWFCIMDWSENVLPILCITTAIMGIVHILNQIADRNSDKINQKLFFIADRIVSLRQAYWQILLLVIFTIPMILYIQIDGPLSLYIIAILPLGILYSLPPFRLKARPVIDTVMNAIGYGWVAFSVGWLIDGTFSWSISLQAIPYILAVTAMYINTTLVDAEGDRKSGFTTTGIWLGKKKATRISLICIILVAAIAFALQSWVCLITAIVSLPVYYKAFISQHDRWIRLSLHLPGRLFVVLTGVIFPYYLVFLILLYFFTRWYYKKRFNMTYPAID